MASQPVTASATSNASRKQGSAPTWSSHATCSGVGSDDCADNPSSNCTLSDNKHLQTAFRLAGPGLPPAPAIAVRNPSADRCAGLDCPRAVHVHRGRTTLPCSHCHRRNPNWQFFKDAGLRWSPAATGSLQRNVHASTTSLIERVFASEPRWRLRPGHADCSTDYRVLRLHQRSKSARSAGRDTTGHGTQQT